MKNALECETAKDFLDESNKRYTRTATKLHSNPIQLQFISVALILTMMEYHTNANKQKLLRVVQCT